MVSRTQEDFILGALIGGAVAAGIALLFTPISGKEARKKVVNGFNSNNSKKSASRSHARPIQHASHNGSPTTKKSTTKKVPHKH